MLFCLENDGNESDMNEPRLFLHSDQP
jgi:hypothetical protein